ncbi:hypothetical protein [Hyphomicrobium sp.]|uniref:hypothetical protein n=1 Tax=Hyphomicrobium sp. TaxID=82 RepID=UPI002E319F11|nr:hypothetical protein [Hyphomicrobium sp.]HEX2841175.1 hypothetical protein [Hyphomicrobium sp.]
MSVAATEELSEAEFMQMVSTVCAADASLTPLGAALIVALHTGIARDTRTFARKLGIEHALVLREVSSLSDAGLVAVTARNARTQRTELALTSAAEPVLYSVAKVHK